jgi:hypothetical protein
MAETAKKRTTRPKVEAVPEPAASPPTTDDAAPHGAGACPVAWCPICMAVTAVQPLRPDVVEHLLKAGTELLLAFKGVLDARAEEMTGDGTPPSGTTRLEKIDLG